MNGWDRSPLVILAFLMTWSAGFLAGGCRTAEPIRSRLEAGLSPIEHGREGRTAYWIGERIYLGLRPVYTQPALHRNTRVILKAGYLDDKYRFREVPVWTNELRTEIFPQFARVSVDTTAQPGDSVFGLLCWFTIPHPGSRKTVILRAEVHDSISGLCTLNNISLNPVAASTPEENQDRRASFLQQPDQHQDWQRVVQTADSLISFGFVHEIGYAIAQHAALKLGDREKAVHYLNHYLSQGKMGSLIGMYGEVGDVTWEKWLRARDQLRHASMDRLLAYHM